MVDEQIDLSEPARHTPAIVCGDEETYVVEADDKPAEIPWSLFCPQHPNVEVHSYLLAPNQQLPQHICPKCGHQMTATATAYPTSIVSNYRRAGRP